MTRRRRRAIPQLRSNLYRAARLLGDVEAAERGPVAYGKRRLRRKLYAAQGRYLRRLLRAFGLSR